MKNGWIETKEPLGKSYHLNCGKYGNLTIKVEGQKYLGISLEEEPTKLISQNDSKIFQKYSMLQAMRKLKLGCLKK